MKTAELGAVVLCAAAIAGCESTPWSGAVAERAVTVQTVALQQVQGCQYIARMDGKSAYPADRDLFLAAMERVRSSAAEKSANALVIRSYEIQSAPNTASKAQLSADVFACNFKSNGENIFHTQE